MPLTFASDESAAVAMHVIENKGLDNWLNRQSDQIAAWVRSTGFTGSLGETLLVPSGSGEIAMVLAGYGSVEKRARGRFHLAHAAVKLPEGAYAIKGLDASRASEESLGWLLASYAFDQYREKKSARAQLVAPDGVDAGRMEAIAAGECLTRDLINTPACDMGPSGLEAACARLAEEFGADIKVVKGEALLSENFPMIHMVGRAAEQKPRLVEMRWGDSGPSLTLVGKGVCFDTGGLNLKPTSAMALMKKDMGGAATVLGLARMIMDIGLKLKLRVLIPAVENSVGGNAFRPGDIIRARNGLTVEINNTDAEGRLVVGDALACGAEEKPDLIISMATLTGAARIAVGADIAPYFTDDGLLAEALDKAGGAVADPVWRMPFHAPYEKLIEPDIADLDNAPRGGMAGAITAALFLRRFASDVRYAHFDIYGWSAGNGPAIPKGGAGQGARALLEALPETLGL